MVANFINLQDGNAETRSFSAPLFTIKSKSYLGKKSDSELTRSVNPEIDEAVPVYELMVDNNNQTFFALVSADERAPGVLALFSDFPTKENEITEGLNHPNTKAIFSLTKYQLIKDIEKVEQTRTEIRDQTVEKICNKLNIPVNEYSFDKVIDKISVEEIAVSRNSSGTQMPSQQVITQKAPMCKIAWTQYEPYNRSCPPGPKMIWLSPSMGLVQNLPSPAGCVTIACMGIEACVERPSIGGIPMNWSYYKSAKTLFEANSGQSGGSPALELDRAGKAIKYIYEQLGSFPQYDTALDINGKSVRYISATAAFSGRGENYITSNFNYTNNQSFDPDVVLSSLNAGKPVFVSGDVYGDKPGHIGDNHWEGHCFVIDGYMITQKAPATYDLQANAPTSRSVIVQYYDMYWHINLGWGGNSNAYFKLDSDATCTPELTDELGRYNLVPLKNMTIITHISKK